MNILLLSPTNNVKNGWGNITHEFCSFLSGKVGFTLLLPKNEPRYPYASYKINYVLPDYIPTFRSKKIFEYLNFKYEVGESVIHSLVEFPYAWLGARLATKYKIPLIINALGTYAVRPLLKWPDKYFAEWAYNKAKIITAPSFFTRDAILKFSGTKTPIRVINEGVNFSRFQEEVNLTELKNLYGNKKVLLTVGGLKLRKGQDLVIRALAKLKKHRDDFHYCIVGKGGIEGYLRSIVKEERLESDVSFLGEIEGGELVKYFQLCDIYVHTPRLLDWNFEGFGIVYLEASACGKPIVATDSGGIRNAVIDGKTGIIVPENDIAQIAQAIEKLLNDAGLRQRLGENGQDYARENDWSKIGQIFLDLYAEIS